MRHKATIFLVKDLLASRTHPMFGTNMMVTYYTHGKTGNVLSNPVVVEVVLA